MRMFQSSFNDYAFDPDGLLFVRVSTLTSQVIDTTSFPGNGDHHFYNIT